MLLCIKWLNMHCLCVERNKGIGHKKYIKKLEGATISPLHILCFIRTILTFCRFLQIRHFVVRKLSIRYFGLRQYNIVSFRRARKSIWEPKSQYTHMYTCREEKCWNFQIVFLSKKLIFVGRLLGRILGQHGHHLVGLQSCRNQDPFGPHNRRGFLP
jgi:hypothetical protein